MKIIRIKKSIVFYVETDEEEQYEYTRHSSENWTVTMGESEEPFYNSLELEGLFQEWISKEEKENNYNKEIEEIFPDLEIPNHFIFKKNEDKGLEYIFNVIDSRNKNNIGYIEIPKIISKEKKESFKYVIENLFKKLEYLYLKSIPVSEMEKIIEKKIYKNNQKEVYCPYCKTEKDNRITKLLPITSSSFFSRRMDLIKIYQCFECKNEFEEKELNRLKWHLQQNIIYEILEEKFNMKIK
jgi:hypothetical protein